jgi:hypothetical protein
MAAVGKRIILYALYAGWKDLEDAIQYYAAVANNIDLIATRDLVGYEEQKVTIANPMEALAILATK